MTDPTLLIKGLQAGYGASRVVDDLELGMGVEAVAVVGRNGMGKTTLCKTIMGLVEPSAGQIHFNGDQIAGQTPEKIARRGLAYVPQGRRLFPSLTVDEHLRMLKPVRDADGSLARWTPDAVYELFPRLAERKKNGGAELSGGEQQMLAIGRALLLNGRLVLMDEPSEGLAPTIVDTVIGAVGTLVAEGVAVLVVEQNLRAAVAMADRILVMVSGRIELETTADVIANDSEIQRRYLGVDA